MEIKLNNTFREINLETSLLTLVSEVLQINQPGIAIAINNEVVQKKNWASHLLSAGDDVLIINATQGG